MNDPNDPQRSSVARSALFLFIFGLLAPPVLILLVFAFSPARSPMWAVEQAAPFAVALGVIAEVLALILGIVGRRHVAGKIAWIGATVVFGLALLGNVLWFFSSSKARPPNNSIPLPLSNPSRMSRVYDEEALVPRRLDRAEDKGPDEVQASHVPTATRATEGPRPVPKGPATLPAGAAEAAKRQDEAAKALGVSKDLTLDLGKGATMKFVLIPAGKFVMGSPNGEAGRSDDEGPQREVTISKPFYVGTTEVTQAQYKAVMGASPSKHSGPDHPVEYVSWEDAMDFCRKLGEKTGRTVRLPTEAQWEYVCRAGSSSRYCFGDNESALGDHVWWLGNSSNETHPVGQKKPNGWGLCDIHGNVWEWCADWYQDSYRDLGITDPTGPASGKRRVLRGGCYYHNPMGCRSAYRSWATPNDHLADGGFRVAADLK